MQSSELSVILLQNPVLPMMRGPVLVSEPSHIEPLLVYTGAAVDIEVPGVGNPFTGQELAPSVNDQVPQRGPEEQTCPEHEPFVA